MDKNKPLWAMVACLQAEQAQARVDSANLAVDIYSESERTFQWHGDSKSPVVSMDGFTVAGETLTLAFRLKSLLPGCTDRLAVGKVVFATSTLMYKGGGNRKGATSIPRRHSVYADEHGGFDPMLRKEHMTLDFEQGKGQVDVKYVAKRYRDPVDGDMVGNIVVTDLCMLWKENLQTILTQRGDKVCCMVQLDSDYGHNEVYLGRPQQIKTRGETRWYYWQENPEATENTTFRGTTNRGDGNAQRQQLLDEANELRIIRGKPTKNSKVSGEMQRILKRRPTLANMSYIPDNDAVSNPCLRLPVSVEQHDIVTILLFNFKVGPPFGPHNISLVLKWADFVAEFPTSPRQRQDTSSSGEFPKPKKRLSGIFKRKDYNSNAPTVAQCTLHRCFAPQQQLLTCTLVYTLNVVEKHIMIESLQFQAENFEKTMQFSSKP